MSIPDALLQKPENRILLLCACGPQKTETFAQTLSTVKDWEYLGRKIRDNRLILLFLHHLKGHESLVPISFLKDFETMGEQLLHWNLSFLVELQEITRALEEGGVRFLCYKGPVLAYEAHQTLALRHFADLDLLVSPYDLEKSLDRLQTLGYRKLGRYPSTNAFFQKCQQRTAYGTHVVSADGLKYLDLHWAIGAPYQGFPLNFENLWSGRAHNFLIGDVATLCSEDLIAALCFHGLKHSWGRLEWIGSLLGVLRSEHASSFDWEYIKATFSRCDCERILYLGLQLASELDAFRERNEGESQLFPPDLAHAIAHDKSVGKMARTAWKLNLRGKGTPLHSVLSNFKYVALQFYFGLWARSRAGKRREFMRGSFLEALSSLERSRLVLGALQPWRNVLGFFQR